MIKQRNSLATLYVLTPIIPIIFVLSSALMFYISMQTSVETDQKKLSAPRFLKPVLNSIIEGEKLSSNIAKGLLFVGTFDGKVYINNMGLEPSDLVKNIRSFGNKLFQSEDFSGILISKFTYKGVNGISFFNLHYLPAYLKNDVRDIFFFIIFLFTSGLVVFGFRTIKNVKETTEALVNASNLIASGNFQIPKIALKQNEMDPIVESFQNMSQELKAKEEMEKRFMMSITHDLKTPLTSIRGYLEAFRDGVLTDPEEIKNCATMMLDKAATLEDRIEESIEFTRNKYIKSDDEYFSVYPLIEKMVPLLQEDSKARDRHFEADINISENLIVPGKEQQIERLIENLFDNACRYTQKGARIKLKVSTMNEHQLFISMEDSGLGVKPENKEKVFQLFFREDQSRNARGMGIGLSIVKSVVESLGGSVECYESELGGAGFSFNIPLHSQGDAE